MADRDMSVETIGLREHSHIFPRHSLKPPTPVTPKKTRGVVTTSFNRYRVDSFNSFAPHDLYVPFFSLPIELAALFLSATTHSQHCDIGRHPKCVRPSNRRPHDTRGQNVTHPKHLTVPRPERLVRRQCREGICTDLRSILRSHRQ